MITKQQATQARHGEEIYSLRNAFPRKGVQLQGEELREPVRAFVSGRCRTWADQPNAFRLLIRFRRGGRVNDLTQDDAQYWTFNREEALRTLNPGYRNPGLTEWQRVYETLSREQQSVVFDRMSQPGSGPLSIADLEEIQRQHPARREARRSHDRA